MGVTSLAAKQVCLGQVKRAQVVQIFLQKVDQLSTFGNNCPQPATSWFVARQIWFVGGKTRNIAIQCFYTTSRWPYWCPKPILWELNSFLMQTISFVPINLPRCWPREWKCPIQLVLQQNKSHVFPARCTVPLFSFILLDSPTIGRVTATAWRQLLRDRNSPSPHERGTTTPGTTSPTLYELCGFFNFPQNIYMQGLWDGAYGLSSLSEKTRKSNLLQMSLQRQHFLLSYLKNVIRNRKNSCLWLWNPKLSIRNPESC